MIKASSNGFFVKEEKVQLCAKSGLSLFIYHSYIKFLFFSLSSRESCFYKLVMLLTLQ